MSETVDHGSDAGPGKAPVCMLCRKTIPTNWPRVQVRKTKPGGSDGHHYATMMFNLHPKCWEQVEAALLEY